MGRSKSSSKREVYSNSISPQETRKISNKQSNPKLKTAREIRTKFPIWFYRTDSRGVVGGENEFT